MRIYDYYTFLKQRKNIKAIKFKEPEKMPYYYDKVYSCFFGRKLKAIYDSDFFDFVFIKTYLDGSELSFLATFNTFDDYIEYIEVENTELEIE